MRYILDRRWYTIVLLVVVPELLGADPKPAQRQLSTPILVEPGLQEKSVLYADGAELELQTETVWRPMCGSDTSKVTVDELRRVAQLSKEAAAVHPWIGQIQGGVAVAQVSFDLVFNVTSALPTGAAEALQAVEQYIEAQFSDSVAVVINIGFASLGPGILGQTGSSYTSTTWPNARAGLQAGMDPDDTIQSFLPAGNTIPVRYNGNTADVTNEDRVYFTLANYRAAIGTVSGTAASMTFSSNFSWDYTPQNGIAGGTYCFQSVLAHEVGHALGFTSGADFRFSDIEALDLYRFQRSDGTGDYNPDTLAEFTTTARMVDQNAPGTDNDVNSDLIPVEYRMSDGSPNQASHFSAQNPGIYIMDPSISSSETFYPDFYRSGDSDMFDAIGWDYPPAYKSCAQALELQCNSQRSFDNSSVSNPANPSYGCGTGTAHNGTLWFRFTATAGSASISTCGSAAQDSTLAVYSGTCGALVEIACSEDGGCGAAGLSSLCVTGLTVGNTYYVQMSARTAAARGLYVLEIGCSCSGSCCLPPPAGCLISKEDECADVAGFWAGPLTTCVGDANNDGRDDTCEVEQAKFSQLPTVGAEDIASNMDWTDLGPNRVLADDFMSDGRPIRSVRWWGSELSPTAPRDGWFISFHEPLAPAQPAGPALGLYFCAAEHVTVTPTPIPVCDPPHAVRGYEVTLADCCLLHANPDSRNSVVPAQGMGFFEELCFDYEIGVQAVVGVRYDENPPGGDCVQTLTANTESGDFWGWHTTANAHGAHAAYSSAVSMAGNGWQYGPWDPVIGACSTANMAFELITTAPAGGADLILWDNGLPNGRDDLNSQFGGQVSDCMTVDDVNFPNGAVIRDFHWFNEEQPAFTWSGRVRLEIYPDTGAAAPNESAMSVGIWVPDDGGTVTRTALGAGQFYPRYRYDVTGLNLTLPPGIWWIGLATADSPGGTGRSYWTTSHSSSPTPLLFFGGEAYIRGSCVASSTFLPWSSFTGGRKSDMSFQITTPNFADCNCNGIDDELDIATLTSTDCNANGVPDECEPDCNGNGVPDDCDITQGSSADCQPNGVPDECDLFFGNSVDCNSNEIPDDCDLADCTGNPACDDCNANTVPDGCDIAGCLGDAACGDCNVNGIPDGCEIADCTGEPACADCNSNGLPDVCDIDTCTGDLACADCNANGVPDGCEPDCNGNGVPDDCDITQGSSADCQPNGVPDECEIQPLNPLRSDCNSNGIPDDCDLADCTGNPACDDCNANTVPDGCDIAGCLGDAACGDCNVNGIPDGCEIADCTGEPACADCNSNGLPDVCDIDTCTGDLACADCNANGVPDGCEPDCNGNGVPDDCDITQGSSKDCQPNGVPDECDLLLGYSVDADNNIIPDECCEPVYPPLAGPETDLKNRFISLQGGNPGKLTALRVKLSSLQHPDPPNLPGSPPTDFSAYEGAYRWVGSPVEYREGLDPQPTFIAARLQCTPYYTDWSTAGLVNVYGAEIMPSSLYLVQAIDQDCNVNGGESNYSTSLTLGTGRWGDVVPPFNPPSTQSQPDAIDIVGLVNKLKALSGAPTKVYTLLHPAILDPSNGINALDIVSGVDALRGFAYPYTGIVACPP